MATRQPFAAMVASQGLAIPNAKQLTAHAGLCMEIPSAGHGFPVHAARRQAFAAQARSFVASVVSLDLVMMPQIIAAGPLATFISALRSGQALIRISTVCRLVCTSCLLKTFQARLR